MEIFSHCGGTKSCSKNFTVPSRNNLLFQTHLTNEKQRTFFMPKKNKGQQPVNEQTLLSLFKEASHPLKKRDVLDLLGADKKTKTLVWALLDQMVDDGTLIRIGRAYGLVDQMPLVKGTFEVQRAGIAFVLPQDQDKQKKD